MGIAVILFFSVIVLYAVFSKKLDRFSVTMPIVFVLAGALMGGYGLDMIDFKIITKNVETITELTLGLLLFADATTLNFIKVKDDARLSSRLLLIGFPLSVIFGAAVAFLFFPSLEIGAVLLIGSILAPTDAALGLPIFNNPLVPRRIRQALNVESGLNDGLATPLVTLFIALLLAEEEANLAHWVPSALLAIAIAIGVGIALGLLGGWLFKTASEKGWTEGVPRQIGVLVLALLVYSCSIALGGNGFVAAFIGGLMFGYATRGHLHASIEFTEISGTLLSLYVWTVFGANMVIPLIKDFQPLTLVYALFSLTLVRMLPVAIALINSHLRIDSKLLMGWFGPRGLASVVFLTMVMETAFEAGISIGPLFGMIGWTILLSVLLHGLSAVPVANWYARRLKTASLDIPELQVVEEIRTRHSAFITR